jgi:autotransporter-associated beta strand protein
MLRQILHGLTLALTLAVSAAAQTAMTWQGPGEDFAAGANWAGGVVPGAGDTAVFAGAAPLAVRLSGASASLATLDFQSPGHSLTVHGGTLNLTGFEAARGEGRLIVGAGGTIRYAGETRYPGAAMEWWLDSFNAGVPVTLDGGRLLNAGTIAYPTYGPTIGTAGPDIVIGFRLAHPRVDVGPGGGTIEAQAMPGRLPWLLLDRLEGTGRLRIESGEVTVNSTAYAGALAIAAGARLDIGAICCEGGPVYDALPSRFDASRITRIDNDGTLVLRGDFLPSHLAMDMTGSGSLSLLSNPRDTDLRILGTLAHTGGTSLEARPRLPLTEMVFDPSRGIPFFREVAQPPLRFVVGDGGTRGWIEGSIQVGRYARLVFHRGDDVTFTGRITGQGSLAQRGPGTLTLTGDHALDRGVGVEGGRLLVTGRLATAGAVEVQAGTLDIRGTMEAGRVTLTGGRMEVAGRLGSLTVTGMLAPGNSIGTLTLAGDLTLAPGATTQIEVEGAASDRIVAGGRAALGGTLQVIVGPGGALINTLYPVITAPGGFSGAFARAEVNDANLEVVPAQGPQSLGFLLRPFVFTPFLDATATPNARRAALAFDVARRAGGDATGYVALLGAPAAAITPLANAMAGEVATAVPALGQRFVSGFLGAMLAPREGAPGRPHAGRAGAGRGGWRLPRDGRAGHRRARPGAHRLALGNRHDGGGAGGGGGRAGRAARPGRLRRPSGERHRALRHAQRDRERRLPRAGRAARAPGGAALPVGGGGAA